MAGGSGVPTSAPTPSGPKLDGGFEGARAHAVNPDGTPAEGGTNPAPMAAAASSPQMPAWLSQFFAPASGAPTPATSPAPVNTVKQFTPGTSLTGYAAPRAPVIWQPPSKPTPAASGASGIPNVPDANLGVPAFRSDPTNYSPEQKKMIEWMEWYNRAYPGDKAAAAGAFTGNA